METVQEQHMEIDRAVVSQLYSANVHNSYIQVNHFVQGCCEELGHCTALLHRVDISYL